MTRATPGAVLAALSGQDRVVVIRRPLVDWLGDDAQARLLDQCLYESDRAAGGWFAVTDEEWRDRLLLAQHKLAPARAALVKARLLETKRRGVPARLYYRMDTEKVFNAFAEWLGVSEQVVALAITGDAPAQNKRHARAEHTISKMVEGVKTVPNGTAQAANGAAPRAPLATHTNGSTQPEPPASPGLPPFAVNGASPAAAAELDDSPAPAKPKRSARNGKASANGSTHAEPNPERAAESKLVFGELCTWLGLDWTRLPANTRGRLNKTAAALLDAGLGADAVQRARDAWRFDWRAKGGQVPDLSQVEGLVARAGAGLTASETPGHYPRYGVHDAPARVKMSEVF